MEDIVAIGVIIFLFFLFLAFMGGITAGGGAGNGRFSYPHDLRTAERTTYTARPVMGYEEAQVLYKIERWVNYRRMGERVFPQVPMGTYLATPDDAAYRAIRFKRPDYVIVNKKGMPICVIEYQGAGHYQGDAAHRDQVKLAALNNANIPLVEIFPHEKDDVNAVAEKLNAAVDGL